MTIVLFIDEAHNTEFKIKAEDFKEEAQPERK